MRALGVTRSRVLLAILCQMLLGLSFGASAESVVTSSDKLLEVIGEDNAVNGRVLSLVIDFRSRLYSALGLDEVTQKHLVKVTLKPSGHKSGYTMDKRVIKSPRGWLFALNVDSRKGVDTLYFEQFLCEIFLQELSLREQGLPKDRESSLRLIPRWIVAGVHEAILWTAGKADAALYKQVLDFGSNYTIDKLLQESSLQGTDLPLGYTFKVSAGVFVHFLLQQNNGANKFVSLVKRSLTYKGEQKELVSQVFPEIIMQEGLNAMWRSQLTLMSQQQTRSFDSLESTLQKLSKLLKLRIYRENGASVEFTPQRYIELKTWHKELYIETLIAHINELSLLEARALLPLRPLVQGYQQVLLKLIDSPVQVISAHEFFSAEQLKLMSITEMVLRLEEFSSEMRALSKSLVKHLDMIEFVEYLDLDLEEKKAYQEEIMRHEIERAQIRDPLGEYLDDLQRLYQAPAS